MPGFARTLPWQLFPCHAASQFWLCYTTVQFFILGPQDFCSGPGFKTLFGSWYQTHVFARVLPPPDPLQDSGRLSNSPQLLTKILVPCPEYPNLGTKIPAPRLWYRKRGTYQNLGAAVPSCMSCRGNRFVSISSVLCCVTILQILDDISFGVTRCKQCGMSQESARMKQAELADRPRMYWPEQPNSFLACFVRRILYSKLHPAKEHGLRLGKPKLQAHPQK